jgi:hypothetical protein
MLEQCEPLAFQGRIGVVARYMRPPFEGLPKQLATTNYAFVAVPGLTEEDAEKLRFKSSPSTHVGTIVSAMNFDPPYSHPREPQYGWVSVLLNDFRDDDDKKVLDERFVFGEFEGKLRWQPKVDAKKTTLVAVVRVGEGSISTDPNGAIGLTLGKVLQNFGYKGLALEYSTSEMPGAYAAKLIAHQVQRSTDVTLLSISRTEMPSEATVFDSHIWEV